MAGVLSFRAWREQFLIGRGLYLPQAMNALIIGTDKHFEPDFSEPFLLIDDGPLIDNLTIPPRVAVQHFDHTQHHVNPLQRIDYRKACDFISVVLAAFPGGQNTLTKEGVPNLIFEQLLDKNISRLDQLFKRDNDDPSYISAQRMIRRILRSPVLSRVLTRPTDISLSGVVLARINRAELGDFDAQLLAWFLMAAYKGQVIVPDGGFYLREMHLSLIRENRLTIGLNYLSELTPALQQAVLSIPSRTVSRTTFDDAIELAKYAMLVPNTNKHTAFIHEAMQ